MIVEPYVKRPVPPAVCLLTEGGGFLLEDGRIVPARHRPPDAQAWASLDRVTALLRAGNGRALCWRGQPIRYCPGSDTDAGYYVRVLGLPFPDNDSAVAGLVRWRNWLAVNGAAPQGSLGSTSLSLLRATLAEPLWTSVPADGCPPVGFTIGGRQELGPAGTPAEYTGQLAHYDLRSAYAVTLGNLEYGGRWHEIAAANLPVEAARLDAAGRMVFVRARVKLAAPAIGPLVRRPRTEPKTVFGYFPEYPTAGTIQGVWTYPELRAASDAGAVAACKLLGGWFHANGGPEPYPFRRWLDRVEAGRELRGFAGLLAKATGNALWGQFCISPNGRKQILYYKGGRRVLTEIPVAGGRKPAHDLSEYLTGKVRAALYRFMAAAGDRLCSAHTDGGWVDTAGGWEYPEPWRMKQEAVRLRVLDPQILAYTTPVGEECYVVAGWPSDAAAERFESDWTRGRVAA